MAEAQVINPAQSEVKATTPLETKVLESVETPQVQEPAKSEDLVSRVSKFKPETKPVETTTNPFGLSKEVYEKVLNTPELKAHYDSMLAGFQSKTKEIAQQREQLNKERQQSSTWTKERLSSEVNKPDFIQAAQQLYSAKAPTGSGLSDEEYSALTDKEKAQLTQMQQQVHQLTVQNWQMQQKQHDEQLKGKYANYDSQAVDIITADLLANKVQATREHLWKAIDYDDAVRRAYELGRQDKQLVNQEKQQALSPEGFMATPQQEVPKVEPGESNSAYFRRIALKRLAESKAQVSR